MRKGEACGLQWRNIDFLKNTITIERTKDDIGTSTPKTKNSYRKILVDRLVIDQFKKYQMWCKQIFLKNGKTFNDQLYVFINKYNNLLHGAAIHKMFKDTLLKAGILNDNGEPKITFHGLRHTYASYMISKNVHFKILQEQLEHTDIKQTLNTYSHLTEQEKIKASDLFDEIL